MSVSLLSVINSVVPYGNEALADRMLQKELKAARLLPLLPEARTMLRKARVKFDAKFEPTGPSTKQSRTWVY